MITTKDNGPVKFLADGETPFDEIQQTDCNCKGREFCQIVHSGDNTPFQVSVDNFSGTNLVSNGTMSTDTVWTKGSGWVISLSRASHTSGGGALSQVLSLKASTYYKIVFSISSYSNSQTLAVSFAGDTIKTLNADGTYTVYWFTDSTLSSSVLSFTPHTSTSLNLDDVSVYELSTVVYGIKDLDDVVVKTVSDGTGVTYYQDTASVEVDWTDIDDGCYRIFLIGNGTNFLEDGDAGSFEDVAANWDITEGSDVYVIRDTDGHSGTYKASVSILGTELVTNGDFASAVGWTAEADWSIGAGVATHVSGIGDNLTQALGVTNGQSYRITFDVTSYSAGTSLCSFGSSMDALIITSTGSYTTDFTYDGISNNLGFYSDANITIDNVSVKRIISPSDSLLFSGDTSITVDPNSDYIISAWVRFPSPTTQNTSNVVYLKPTTYSLSQCRTVIGSLATGGVASVTRTTTFSDGNILNTVLNGTALGGQWVKIQTIFNSGVNTSLQIGVYIHGELDEYIDGFIAYIDDMELRGPVEVESECFKKGSFDCTQVLSWSSNENSYGYTYEGTNFQHEVRLQSKLWQPGYKKEKKEVFTDSAGTRKILTSRTKKEEILTIGEIPTYLHDAISIGVEHDNFYVDGVKYINEETDYDPDWRKSSLLAPVELKVVKDSQNLQNSYC